MGWTQAAELALVRAGELLPWPDWALGPREGRSGFRSSCRSAVAAGGQVLTWAGALSLASKHPPWAGQEGPWEPYPQPW